MCVATHNVQLQPSYARLYEKALVVFIIFLFSSTSWKSVMDRRIKYGSDGNWAVLYTPAAQIVSTGFM